MTQEKKTAIGIITARAGSKGLPGKNLRAMCGKPLIAWTIEKAKKSKWLDEVMVTTDGEEIAEVAKSYGARAPFLRTAALATDTATSFDTVVHVLEYYKREEGRSFDYVVLLEPTSPLREDDDIDRMLADLDRQSASYDSIVSIGEVGTHPAILKKWEHGVLSPFCPELPLTTRRQDNAPAYFPYGVAYIVKTDVLLREKTFYSQRCLGFPIQRYQCYEVDDIHDFICTESIMRWEWKL
jgi:CMP-N,N'-diacetyllegionaminic acid synthase